MGVGKNSETNLVISEQSNDVWRQNARNTPAHVGKSHDDTRKPGRQVQGAWAQHRGNDGQAKRWQRQKCYRQHAVMTSQETNRQ